MPVLCAAAVAQWARSGGQSMYLVLALFGTVFCVLVGRVIFVGVRTWVEVGAEGVTWRTPPRASAHFSPSGSLPASEIAAMAVAEFRHTPSTPRGIENAAKLAVSVQLAGGDRVVLPIASGREQVSPSLDRLVEALSGLPGVTPIDVGAIAALPRAGARRPN
jgi:hypothetical protein